ncbi:MAG: Translational regulator CsrA [Oscillospiraceae bacterium]
MLIITRKTSESIQIGSDIEITVTEISGERVKIGINAPKGIPIMRKELLETQELNKEASTASSPDKVDAFLRLVQRNEIQKNEEK